MLDNWTKLSKLQELEDCGLLIQLSCMKESSITMVNQMVLVDSLVNPLLFKVCGKQVRFMELLRWFKITSPKDQSKRKVEIAKFKRPTQLKQT